MIGAAVDAKSDHRSLLALLLLVTGAVLVVTVIGRDDDVPPKLNASKSSRSASRSVLLVGFAVAGAVAEVGASKLERSK